MSFTKKIIQISIFIMIVGIFGIFDLQKTKAAECGGDVVCACGDTVTSDYTLSADLDCSSSDVDGLIVGANSININGNNNKISGAGGNSKGIKNNLGYDNITIKNFANITNFTNGIYFNNSDSNILTNNIVNSNSYGIYLYNSYNSVITNNTANLNLFGIYLLNSSNSAITNNIVNYNERTGISLLNSSNSAITNNIVNFGVYGIIFSDSHYNTITNNTINSNLQYGIYLVSSSHGTLTENTVSNNTNSTYDDTNYDINNVDNCTLCKDGGDDCEDCDNYYNEYYTRNNIYSNNNFLYNSGNKMLTFTEINRVLGLNSVVTSTISMFDSNGNECPDCAYSITTSPLETIISQQIGNIVTSTFTVAENGIYSLIYTIIDSNNNTTKRNFLFFADTTTRIAKYYFRGIMPTHNQPASTDAKSLLFVPPVNIENWMCGWWVQTSPDEIPDYPFALLSDTDISTWYRFANLTGYVGIQRFTSYDENYIWDGLVDLSSEIFPSIDYAWVNKNFANINWSMDYLKSWYLFTIKVGGSPIFQQTSPSQPSYVDFTYQYTTTPAIKSISNENIIVLSATAPANATSSASIVLDNPNTSATSTTLVLTDFKRPFIGATSTIDFTSTTTLTTTIGASSSSTLDAVTMDIVPSYGSVEVSIDTWNTTGDYYKKWTEEGSDHDISTSHTIGDLPPNTNYVIKVNGISYAGSKSNSSGEITFTYDDGYSTKTFELIEDTTPPVITILGSNPVSIYVGDNYTDSGATASDNIDGDITNSIVITNTVNTSIVGSYTVTYNVSDTASNPATQVVRVVNVLNRPGGGIPLYMLNIMNQQNQNNQITTNQTTENNNINQTTIKDNQIFKYYNDNKVYLLENGLKRWIKDEESFNKLGYKWSDIEVIDDNTIVYSNGIDLEVIKPLFTFTKILKLRSFGSDVIQLQTILKRLGYFTYPRITNFFGSYTYNAVIKFQKANKLKATGIVDKATMDAINKL